MKIKPLEIGKKRKGLGLTSVIDAVLAMVVIGAIIAFGLIFLAQFKGQNSYSATANTAIDQMITAIASFPPWFTLVVLAIIFGILITVIFGVIVPRVRGGGAME